MRWPDSLNARRQFLGTIGVNSYKGETVLTLRGRILAGIAISLVTIFVVGWFVLLKPIRERKESALAEMRSLSIDLERLKGLQDNVPGIQSRLAHLRAQLAKARDELPEKREIPGLLSAISERANEAGLEVRLFQPRDEVLRDFYAEVPVQIIVDGTYHEVAQFFDQVSRLDRIVTVGEVSMRNSEPAEPSAKGAYSYGRGKGSKDGERSAQKLLTSCIVTTFRLLAEGEMIKAQTAH